MAEIRRIATVAALIQALRRLHPDCLILMSSDPEGNQIQRCLAIEKYTTKTGQHAAILFPDGAHLEDDL